MKGLSIFILELIPFFSMSYGQELDFWALGNVPKDMDCAKGGINMPGSPIPPFSDPWFIVLLAGVCQTYKGSISCQNEQDYDGVMVGTCLCNQGPDHEFDWNTEACVGKVGAICTAEKTSFIPEKRCVAYADCIPEQGEGHSVGRCKCLQGYVEDSDRNCVEDPTVPDKGIPRITTTTEAPDRGDNKFPSDLIFNMDYVQLGEACHSAALLNRTYCDTYDHTVSCINKKCQCNMGVDNVFDLEVDQCVGLAGSYCLARKMLLGFKSCVEGADCFVEDGTDIEEQSFGTCQCLYGYIEEADGTCSRDPSIPDPSTKRPTPTTIPTTLPTPPGHSNNMTYSSYFTNGSHFLNDTVAATILHSTNTTNSTYRMNTTYITTFSQVSYDIVNSSFIG